MSRIARLLGATNWRYAAGELLLIVVGVTIALAATAWYESGQRSESEGRILGEISDSLKTDLVNLKGWRADIRRFAHGLNTLGSEIVLGQECSEIALENMGLMTAFRYIHLNLGPYEALKSQGLDLVDDDDLRMRIVEFYDSVWPDLVSTVQIGYEFMTSEARPYMLQNFVRTGPGIWVPIDNSICGSDPHLKNLVMWRVGGLEGFELPDYDEAIEAAESLLSDIANDLERRL